MGSAPWIYPKTYRIYGSRDFSSRDFFPHLGDTSLATHSFRIILCNYRNFSPPVATFRLSRYPLIPYLLLRYHGNHGSPGMPCQVMHTGRSPREPRFPRRKEVTFHKGRRLREPWFPQAMRSIALKNSTAPKNG